MKLLNFIWNNIKENSSRYILLVIYTGLISILFPAVNPIIIPFALLRKICIPIMIFTHTENFTKYFWVALVVGTISNLIVDGIVIIGVATDSGFDVSSWLPVILLIIVSLSIMYLWTMDRLFVRKFRLTRLEKDCIALFIRISERIRAWMNPYFVQLTKFLNKTMEQVQFLAWYLSASLSYFVRSWLMTRFW